MASSTPGSGLQGDGDIISDPGEGAESLAMRRRSGSPSDPLLRSMDGQIYKRMLFLLFMGRQMQVREVSYAPHWSIPREYG